MPTLMMPHEDLVQEVARMIWPVQRARDVIALIRSRLETVTPQMAEDGVEAWATTGGDDWGNAVSAAFSAMLRVSPIAPPPLVEVPVMSAKQIELARHALGLPSERGRSYRNRFFASEGHRDYADWNAMVDAGFATVVRKPRGFGGNDFFELTRAGAETALQPNEILDEEDFDPRVVGQRR